MDMVRHGMSLGRREVDVEVVFEIVGVHVPGRETAARGNVEIANHLVDTDYALQTTSFVALSVDSFRVVLAHALLDVLATSECPLFLRVRFPHFVACVAAAGLDGVVGRGSAAAFAAVCWVEVLCGFVAGVAGWVSWGSREGGKVRG